MNENSVHVKGTGKCEEIDDTSDGGGPKKNQVLHVQTPTQTASGAQRMRERPRESP